MEIRESHRDLADAPGRFELVLVFVGLCISGHAAIERIQSLVPERESEIGLLIFGQRQIAEDVVTGFQIAGIASARARRRNSQALSERRVGGIIEPASGKPGVDAKALRLVTGHQAKAESLALFRIGEITLIEVAERQQ